MIILEEKEQKRSYYSIFIIAGLIIIVVFGFLIIRKAGQLIFSKNPASTNTHANANENIKSNMLRVSSGAFGEGQAIPEKYTCDGQNVNPPLSFGGAIPANANNLVLIVDDPDAPSGIFTHWIVFNVSPNLKGLDENVSLSESILGKNDFGKLSYNGPCPPSGATHRYYFKIFALDEILNIQKAATRGEVENAMKNHILAAGQLMGKYTKK